MDKWCSPEWSETHAACRERHLMMTGAPHHQGNLTLAEYAERWVRDFIYVFQRLLLHSF